MAVADRTLMLKLIADVNQPAKELKGLGGTLKRSASAAKAWGKAFTGALVIGGIEKLVGSLDDALAGFKEGEDAARRVSQTWKTLGRDSEQLDGILESLGDQAIDLGFDDAEVLTAFNTFLAKSGSVKDSTAGVTAAMNLARAKGISFSRAVKIVTGQLGELDPALKRNKQQARIWARNHPLEVGLGRITDLWETFVGEFSRGRINRAFAALGGIGAAINDLLFGAVNEKTGERTGGLIDRFVDVGRKLVPALILGLGALGEQLLNAWNTAVAGVDWGATLGNAVGAAVELLLDNQNIVLNLGIVAGSLAAGLFVIDVFAGAAAAMFSAPKMLANAALQAALKAFGWGLMQAIRVAAFIAESAVSAMANGIRIMVNSIPSGPESTIGKAAKGLGGAIQKAILIGLAVGFLDQVKQIVDAVLDSVGFPQTGVKGLRYNPTTGKWERFASGGTSSGGWAMVGEQGAELVRLPGGSRVYPADETAAMVGAGGWAGITVNVYAGVGNPVEIGRQVDQVLRAYRGRAGLPA